MQKLLLKMEKKLGRYAIPNLINYFIILYVVTTLLSLFAPIFFYQFLALDFNAIKAGQIWRIFTFILAPASLDGMFGILFFVLTIYIYYLFGHSLENVWGAFRFNLYFFSGILFTLLAEFILYIFTGQAAYYGGMHYLYQSMFFAFCTLFPDERFLVYFIIPIKAKWIAILDAALLIVNMLQYLAAGAYTSALAIIVAMLNFLIFYYAYKGLGRFNPRQQKRRREFRQATTRPIGVTKHKCAICGRTEVSNPELSFRFCSKCNGNYEYCEEHLFTHKHVGM